MSDDEDVPYLSVEAFNALQEFYVEQEQKEAKLAQVVASNGNFDFDEDWQLSQFWYDDSTIDALVTVALKTIEPGGKVALISCPTLYKKMRQQASDGCEINVYEFDQRFAAFGPDFTLYNYKAPLDIPRDKSNYYDLVIADPPFLSEECLTKMAVTMKFLSKNKLILCSGAVMADLAKRLLDLNKCKLEPHHKNNLANEFCCYSNYNIDELLL